jgi:uncharacterized membrane protein (UPF0182 family)
MATVRIPARQRRWPAFVIGGLVGLALLFTVMSTFYVDLLWYGEVGLTGVFWTELRTKAVLGLVFGLLFFALLYANLLIARRIAPPPLRFLTPEQEAIERVRMAFEPFLGWLVPLAAGLLALLVGIGVSRQWQVFLLWRYSGGVAFGDPEPLFNRDPAFYVFSLPWMEFLQGWLFSSAVGITFLTAVAHLFWGGIRPQARTWGERVAPATRAHLSVLLGVIMLIKAWGYYLGRFDLLSSRRGVVQGASYTDVNAQLPALNFLIIAAIICAVLFFANIVRQRWALPIIAVVVLAAVSVLLGTAYPAFVQRFRVTPQEFQREEPFIQRNIDATRIAFGIVPGEDIDSPPERAYDPQVTTADLRANEATISNVRLWRPSVLRENFQSLQRIRSYYEFRDVDVDRYDLDGERRVLMVSGREVSQEGIQPEGRTWQNEHLVYTHGFGAVASQVNTSNLEGAPVLELADIPVRNTGGPPLEQPRIYFGEGAPTDPAFVVTKTETAELDYDGAPAYSYTGDGGIEVGNVLRRALFSWRFRDVNLLISGQISGESRIMIYRDIYTRVPKPVPFLTFDHDPYLTIVDGRLVWIWDAYTTTNDYPYSESIDLQAATEGQMPPAAVNYMRNSVKVAVDAYDGTMDYYADLTDPIIQVWDRAFPELFTDMAEADLDLRAHFRYPENLFQVQATHFGNYHVSDPGVFYQKQDRWEIAGDPTQQPVEEGTTTLTSTSGGPRLAPYYLLMKAPGEDAERFQLVLPFVPAQRQNMVAWLAASSDPENYGRLLALELPAEENVAGPTVVFARMNQDPRFSAERTLLGQGGSQVIFGDLLVIPIEDSFLYVQPVYVRANQEAAVPELKRVVVVNGDTVGFGPTLADALQSAVGDEVVPPDGGGEPGGGDQTVAELLAEAADHFAAAEEALRAGDLATYQQEIEAAQDLVAQALELSGQEPTGGTTASPSPATSPSPSPSP